MESEPIQSEIGILSLPTETRFMIYDHVLTFTGSLVVFAQYEFTQNVDKQTMNLLHVNRTIRHEVQEYFYRNQHFQFRSFPAMEKFLDKIGPYYTSIVKKVVIGSWLAQRGEFGDRMAPLLKRLTGIDHFAIIAPASGFVSSWYHMEYQIGDKTIAVLRASERLAAGKLYHARLWYTNKFEICFMAEGVQHTPDESFLPPEHRYLGTGTDYTKYTELEMPASLMQVGGRQELKAQSSAEVKAQIQGQISAGTCKAIEIDDGSSASEPESIGSGEDEAESDLEYNE